MEKGQDLFQDTKPEERAELLASLAAKTEFQKIRRHYDADETTQMKDFVSSESIDLMDKKEEFAKIKKEFNLAAKTLGGAITDALKDIKRGYSENEESVYLVDDQTEGKMHIYDKKGIFLSTRNLYPEERQTKILDMAKTGTND